MVDAGMVMNSKLHLGPQAPKEAEFFEDPQHPERSRHLNCWKQAGINPKKAGYARTGGPCWTCEYVAGHDSVFYSVAWILAVAREIGNALVDASDRGFALEKAVRCATRKGTVQRADLERELGGMLKEFRDARLKAASIAFLVPLPEGQRWMQQIVYLTIFGTDANRQLNPELDPRRFVVQDPTAPSEIRMEDLADQAGKLGNLARRMLNSTAQLEDNVLKNRGSEAIDNVVRAMSQVDASPLEVAKMKQPADEDELQNLAATLRQRKTRLSK